MPEKSLNSAEVIWVDRDRLIEELRRAAAAAKARAPEIERVLLFGSLVTGNWTADSDADLIVVVRRQFADIFERSRYQIHTRAIPTDSLVFSTAEFAQATADPHSFVSQALPSAVEL